MSHESQKIAALRDRLLLIESTQVNEFTGLAGRALGGLRNIFKGPKPAAPKPAAPTPPSTTPPGTVHRATPNNPNASRAEVPGAAPVTKDLTGAPVNPGGISATGSVGAARAQTAADAQLAAQRAASKDALGVMRPTPVGGAVPKPVGGAGPTAATGVANALKNNPGKTAAATAAAAGAAGYGLSGDDAADPAASGASAKPAGAGGAAGAGAADAGAADAGAAGSSALSPEERKELDALAAELEVHMGRLPELDSLLLQHQALAQGGGSATKPSAAANPDLDVIKKNAGLPPTGNNIRTAPAVASAEGNAGEAEAQAAMAAKQPAASSGTRTTQSNQSVQGTIKMGKPEGPITFNGKVVNPGQPEYAAASAALMKSQSDLNARSQRADSQRARQQGAAPASTTSTEPASTIQQVAPGRTRADF